MFRVECDVTISPEIDYFSKDCRLPIQLQRAMAAEAEAAREARAKVSVQTVPLPLTVTTSRSLLLTGSRRLPGH